MTQRKSVCCLRRRLDSAFEWRSRVTVVLAAFIFNLSSSTAVHACSVDQNYFVPTNFELVQIADAIVIAEVASFESKSDETEVRFRTVEVLKGHPKKTFLGWGGKGRTKRSDPLDLSRAHPEAYSGSCNRWSFRKDRLYVLFLGTNEKTGELAPLGYPFARINEDVTDADSFWVRVIKQYLDIQDRFGPEAQIERLQGLAREIHSRENTPENLSLLQDIETHLATMSPRKPTQYLVEAYRALEEMGNPNINILGAEAHRENSMAEKLTALVMGPGGRDYEDTAERFKQSILWSLAYGDHPGAVGLFDELLLQSDNGKFLPPALAYLGSHGQLERAKQVTLEKTFMVLSLEDGYAIKEFVRAAPLNEMPIDYRVALYWSLREKGLEYRLSVSKDELDEVHPSDYRANERLTIAMATGYYEPVIRWAFEELAGQKAPEQERLPVLAILNSSRDEAEERVFDLFCDGGHRREFLIQGLANMDRYGVDDWILRIGLFDGLTEKERELFGKTLAARVQRSETLRSLGGGGWDVLLSRDYEKLERFLNGEKLKVPDWKDDLTLVDCK